MFVDFIDAVRKNPEVPGDDDAAINTALLDYQSEYAFAALGVGFALGKLAKELTAEYGKTAWRSSSNADLA